MFCLIFKGLIGIYTNGILKGNKPYLMVIIEKLLDFYRKTPGKGSVCHVFETFVSPYLLVQQTMKDEYHQAL